MSTDQPALPLRLKVLIGDISRCESGGKENLQQDRTVFSLVRRATENQRVEGTEGFYRRALLLSEEELL